MCVLIWSFSDGNFLRPLAQVLDGWVTAWSFTQPAKISFIYLSLSATSWDARHPENCTPQNNAWLVISGIALRTTAPKISCISFTSSFPDHAISGSRGSIWGWGWVGNGDVLRLSPAMDCSWQPPIHSTALLEDWGKSSEHHQIHFVPSSSARVCSQMPSPNSQQEIGSEFHNPSVRIKANKKIYIFLVSLGESDIFSFVLC